MADKQNLAKKIDLNTKQDILIAGQNITIAADGKTISAANPTSVTVTPVYQAGTLVAAIVVNGNTTNIYAPAQHGDNANQNLALSFSAAQTYEVGDFVIYQENLYQCITAINTPAAWDSTKWTRALITDVMGQGGGGLDLPDNWSLDEEALTVMALNNDLNELGWKVEDDTYYFDTAARFSLGDREYTKDNAKPALGGVIGQPGDWQNKSIVLTSTDASATHFSWNSTTYSFTYLGTTWYYCGGNYAYWGSPASGIEVIPDDTLTLEQAAKYLIDYSQVSFTDDRFTTMNQPGSGTLFAGGGEETDLSDATFKVTSGGGVYGTEFYKNGVPIGDGGNVDDVYVNGQSVLDANKIAQIKSYKEVTQAEYDALPASKESDDVLYCITDQATADTTVAPVIYSTEEREIGVWTDGKPLYQKTLYTASAVDETYIDITSLSVDTLVLGQGSAYNPSNVQVPISYAHYAYTNNITFFLSATRLEFRIGSGNSPITDAYITLQYTKTTDQPGSGKYAPSGVPAVHYSENEQVVGTWVDGSAVYERSIDLGSFSVSSWGDHTIESSINIAVMIDYEGYIIESNVLYALPDPSVRIKIDANKNLIFTGTASWDVESGHLTIRYTKSTS